MSEVTTNDPKGSIPRRIALSETTELVTESRLEPALTAAIALARAGDWPRAERVVHDCFRALPPLMLPHAYIAAIALVPRLLADTPAGEHRGSAPAIDNVLPRADPTPRLLAIRDPAFDYAHAVLTALRGRLAVRALSVRQAS